MMQCYSNDAEDCICILFLSTYHSQRLIKYPTEISISSEFNAFRITGLGGKKTLLGSYCLVSPHMVGVMAHYTYIKCYLHMNAS